MKKEPILLCVDPGKNNFAYSILDRKGKLLDYMLILSTFNDLTSGKEVIKARNKLLRIFTNIHKSWPTSKYNFALVYERFIPRSMQRGNLGEIVNMCIGGLLFSFPPVTATVVPLTAASWKNYVKKQNWVLNNATIPIHVLDSIMMGYYWLHKTERLKSTVITKNIASLNRRKFGWVFKNGVWRAPTEGKYANMHVSL